jgi:putative FmdB family regulatory protein
MPIYEYRCPTCRTVFELLQPMKSSDRPVVCPKGHQTAERIVSLVAASAWGGTATSASDVDAVGGCGGCGAGCACGH